MSIHKLSFSINNQDRKNRAIAKVAKLCGLAHPKEIAQFLFELEVPPTFSTGIDGSDTAGYGKLDDCGFWQYPLQPKQVAELLGPLESKEK